MSALPPRKRTSLKAMGMSALCQKRRKLHSLGQPDIVGWEQVIHDHKPDDRQWRSEQSAHRAPHPGPKCQRQKHASGLSVSRRPTSVGVIKWPSSVVSAINPRGAISACASEGNVTSPTPKSTTTITAGPI